MDPGNSWAQGKTHFSTVAMVNRASVPGPRGTGAVGPTGALLVLGTEDWQLHCFQQVHTNGTHELACCQFPPPALSALLSEGSQNSPLPSNTELRCTDRCEPQALEKQQRRPRRYLNSPHLLQVRASKELNCHKSPPGGFCQPGETAAFCHRTGA